MLNIDIKTDGNSANAVLEGRLDVNTSSELKEKVGGLSEDITNIDLDLEKLSYTSSAGLRVILQIHNQLKQRGGKLVLTHPNEVIMEVLEDTGLADCLNIQN